jgi:hypothetical protein
MDTILATFDFDHPIWQGILLVLLLGMTILIAWPPLQKIWAHRYLHRLIGCLGSQSLRHISVMDGADVPLYIEYLILQPDGLLLLIIKPFRGNIFAADKIENWTQVVRHHSFKFANPLHELETTLQALRGMLPKINVRGLVIFTQGAHFPKGKPQAVCDFEELKDLATRQDHREIPEALHQAWADLASSVQQNKRLYPAVLYQRGDKRRLLLSTILLIGCLIYIAHLLGWLKGII